MKQYWCYTCSEWRNPWAADECAISGHHVVSAKKKEEIDKAQDERILKILLERGPLPEGSLEEIIGADVSREIKTLVETGRLEVTADWKLKVKA